ARGIEQLQAQELAEIVWHGSPTQTTSSKLNDRINVWHALVPNMAASPCYREESGLASLNPFAARAILLAAWQAGPDVGDRGRGIDTASHRGRGTIVFPLRLGGDLAITAIRTGALKIPAIRNADPYGKYRLHFRSIPHVRSDS